ncbi:hypothetical protein TWF281_009747 [Arthrobotrys megalospora]
MSSSDDKLPTSTLARSFSAQLNDIFLLDEVLSTKEKEVDQKKFELTQQNAELDALEARLKEAEARLAKQSKRMSLLSPDSAPTPANTEVGNPLSPSSSTRRRNPIPLFQDPSADTEAAGADGEQDIAGGSAPEPPKKDDPVALQAPRALPVLSREIEAREEVRRSEEEEWGGGGGTPGRGPGGYDGGDDRDDIGVTSNTSLFTSTFANPDVPKDKIQFTSFLEKELPKLSEGQGQFHAQADAAQQQQQYHGQPTFPTASQEYEYRNRTFEPESTETFEPRNSGALSATAASINGQNHPITVKPDEDGDELATGDLIDQYGYDSEPEPEEEEPGHQTVSSSIGNTHATQPIVPTTHVSNTAVSVTRPNRSDSLASPVRNSSITGSATGPTPNTQESTNTKYIVDDGFFTRPRRAPTLTNSELPPLPGQTPDIPKRKPVRGSEDNSRPDISLLTTDRPPTPPSKAPRNIVNTVPYDYNTSHLSVATNSTDNRTIPSMSSSDSTHGEKPLPPMSPSEASLEVPVRESVTERGFGGLLKMKKSLQGLRKKAQAASSPISPTGDPQRSFSTGALGHYPSSDPKDEPPLPPIPPEKLNSPVPAIPVQYRASPPPQSPQTPSQFTPQPAPPTDLFDRIQASLPNQQQEEPSPRRFEGKHKKAVEAIAKFSGKMSALRALRKKEVKEESPPPPQASQEPPLAAWEIEQRANSKGNPYGHPISPPQTASLNAAPQTAQTWKSQSSGYSVNGYVNNQTPISPPQEPLSDDALPAAPAKLTEEAPPPTPAKYELPLPKRIESLSMGPPGTPEKPDPTSPFERSSPERPRTSSSRGLSIFPSSSTTRPLVPTEMAPPAPLAKEAELPPPPPEKLQPFAPFKPLTLEFSTSNNLSVEKPQPSPGLAPPVSPGFAPGRGGRTETYSFLGDYYFGDNQDGDDQFEEPVNGTSSQRPQSPPQPEPARGVSNIKRNESDDKLNFRIKSFAPFSLGEFSSGDFSSSFSFDDLKSGSTSTEQKPPPMPRMPDLKSLPNARVTPAPAPTPVPAPPSAPPSTALPEIPVVPPKAERRSPAIPESIPEDAQAPNSLPEAPKAVQRIPSKPELRDKHPTPLQTVAHRSILSSSVPTGRESSGSPQLPMKDIPEEGPYPSTKSPLSATSAPGSATSSTVSAAPINKAGYASGVSSVRSSSGYTESPSATSSRTSLSSGINGPTSGVATPTPRVPSGEQGSYPVRNLSQGFQPRPPSQDTSVDRRVQSGAPNMPPSARPPSNMHPSGPPHGMPPGPPQGMPPRGRMPGPPPPGATPELRGRPGFRPPPGGPMGPGYPPRSASPAFSERSMRPPRGPPPPRSASPAFSERRGPPPPRSSSPAFSMRGDPRMPRPGPPPHHGRKRSNSMEILDFAVDFELPSSALRFEAKEAEASRRARSESNTGYGGRGPPPGAFRGRAESPGPREGFRSGSRAGSRGPPGVPPHMNGPGSRPGSRTQSPFRHPPVSHNFNNGMPPRGMPGSRRNSGGSNAGGNGGRRPSMSEADLDIALGVGQIPGQERKYRPPPQMRGGRPPPGPMPPMPQGGGRGLKSLNGGGVTYPGLDDGFGMMDGGGRMPAPSMPRREEMA